MECRYSWNQAQASAVLHAIPCVEKAGWGPEPVYREGEECFRLWGGSKLDSSACLPVTCDCIDCLRDIKSVKKRMKSKEREQESGN